MQDDCDIGRLKFSDKKHVVEFRLGKFFSHLLFLKAHVEICLGVVKNSNLIVHKN